MSRWSSTYGIGATMSSARRAELAQRAQGRLGLVERSGVADDDADHRLPAHRLGDELRVRRGEQRRRRRRPRRAPRPSRRGSCAAPRPPSAPGRAASRRAPSGRSGGAGSRTGRHAEVAAAAARGPEQVRVLVLRGGQDPRRRRSRSRPRAGCRPRSRTCARSSPSRRRASARRGRWWTSARRSPRARAPGWRRRARPR